jgi:Ca-activated chloride channel family protein
MMFRFAYPAVLALLVAVAGWVAFALWRKPPSIGHPGTSTLIRMAGSISRVRGRIPLILRAVCLTLLVLAAARPQYYNVSRETKTSGVDIVLCLDTSGTMRAMDFKIDGDAVDRLTAVKKVVKDFIVKRERDRIGLVIFGDEAFTQCPLTLDKGLLLNLVDKLEVGMAGDRTAIGDAIAVAGKRLKDLKAKARILVLLTDGRHNAGDITPLQAAAAVRALGIKVYAIGVGGKGPAPFRVDTMFGPRMAYQEVDLDEETLTRVAQEGGGKYFRAADSKRLSEIYDIIDREEKSEVDVKEFFHFRELYMYFLIPALALLGLEIVLSVTIFRVIP